MGWWGTPGCGCCDGCQDCMGYEETFDGSGTLTVIGWDEVGTVARVSGEVIFGASNPKARISNSTVSGRLTGNVKTTFEFEFLYEGAGCIVEVIMQGTPATGSLFVFVEQDILSVGDLENQEWIDTAPLELEINTTYTFEVCVDDTNDIVYLGIVGIAQITVDIANGGLDHIDIIGTVKAEYLPPIPPSTTGTEILPEDDILMVDNFKQFERVDEDPSCCACGRVSTPETPSGGTLPSPCVALSCPDLTYEMAITLENLSNDGYSCCTGFNDTFTLYNRGHNGQDSTCGWTMSGGCQPWFQSDVISCCTDDPIPKIEGYPFYSMIMTLILPTATSGNATLQISAGAGYWYINLPIIRFERGPGIFLAKSTQFFDFENDGCDEMVFTDFVLPPEIFWWPPGWQNCDISTLVATITPLP